MLSLTHSVGCVLCKCVECPLCDKNYQFLCVDLNGQTMKMEIKGSWARMERVNQPLDIFVILCCVYVFYTLCTREPYFSFSLQVFSFSSSSARSHSPCYLSYSIQHCLYVCSDLLFTQWPSDFFFFFFFFFVIRLSFYLIHSHIFITVFL